MTRRKPKVGDVIQLALPDGRFAYGRVLKDASVAFYARRSRDPGQPPIGDRDYEFVVGVYDDVLRASDVRVVGQDPSREVDDDWPPPYCVRDRISGTFSIYYRGSMRPASAEECRGLEAAAVWDKNHLINRLMQGAP